MSAGTNVLQRLMTDDDDPGDVEREPRKPRHRILRYSLSGGLLVAVLGGVGWLGSWNSPIPIREVVVHGAEDSSVGEILSAAALAEGTQINEVDRDGITRRVDTISGIERVDIELSRPWTVVIRVLERHAFAVVATEDGYSVIDDAGLEIRTVRDLPKRFPEVTADGERLSFLLSVLADLPDDMRRDILSARVAENGNAIFRLRHGGSTVIWGSADRTELKLDVLRALLPFKAGTYNVTVPERPAVGGQVQLPAENVEPTPGPAFD